MKISTDTHFLFFQRFDIPDDKDTFFTPSERSVAVEYVLQRVGLSRAGLAPKSATSPDGGADGESGEINGGGGGGTVTLRQKSYTDEIQTGARSQDKALAESGKIDLGIDQLVSRASSARPFLSMRCVSFTQPYKNLRHLQ